MVYFYKSVADDLYYINDNVLPAGKYLLRIFEEDTTLAISVESADSQILILSPTNLTDVAKEDGTFYTDITEFLSEVGDFFKGGSLEGSAAQFYSNSTPTPFTIGGIEAGSTFDEATMQEMWDDLLYPYLTPSFTSFRIDAQGVLLEVGQTVPGGNRTFIWQTANSVEVTPDSIEITDDTASVVLATGLADDGSELVDIGANITKTHNTFHRWKITGINTNSNQFSRTFNVVWAWKLHYGESTKPTLVEADIKGLRASKITNSVASEYPFIDGGYKYITHETSLGTLTNFFDQGTGFSVPFQPHYLVTITNDYGIASDYKVYRSSNILNSSILIKAN